MRAFLRAEADSVGVTLGYLLLVAGVAIVSVPGALIVAGVALAGASVASAVLRGRK